MTEQNSQELYKQLKKASLESADLKSKLATRSNVLYSALEGLANVAQPAVILAPLQPVAEKFVSSEPSQINLSPSIRETIDAEHTTVYSSQRDSFLEIARAGVEDVFAA